MREQLELRLQNKTGMQKVLQNTIERCALSMGIDVPSISIVHRRENVSIEVQKKFGAHIALEMIGRRVFIAANAPNRSATSTKDHQLAKIALN